MNVDNETDKHKYLKPRHWPLNVLCSSGMNRNGNQTRPTELRENQQLESHIIIYTRDDKIYKFDRSNELNQITILNLNLN